MTPFRTRSTARYSAIVVGAALLLVSATGCTAVAGPEESASNVDAVEVVETPVATPTQTPTQTPAETTSAADAATCEGFADVQTILLNAETALHQERMTEKEKGAWFSLASRVLGNVPSADEGPVAEALATLKQEYPAVPDLDSTAMGSAEEWYTAAGALMDACDAAGHTVIANAFTGG
ncbi:hypothetical protein ACNPNP_00995 [Microbacterium sp. AGC85]